MAVTEEARHRLYEKLEEVIGTARTNTLMTSLPPTGWEDVPTKQDLVVLRAEIRGDMFRQMLGVAISIVAANSAVTALVVGVAKLG